MPGTTIANVGQQKFFADVATKAVLPMFKARNKPFVLVFWSRDPDGTQHNQGDSLGRLVPGINGPTSLAAIRNADDNLASLLDALKQQGLDGTTDVILTSDHGFATISKESATSCAATQTYKDMTATQLPLRLRRDRPRPCARHDPLRPRRQERRGRHRQLPDARQRADRQRSRASPSWSWPPTAARTSFISRPPTRRWPRKVVAFLSTQDYTSGALRRRFARQDPGHLADVGDRAEGLGGHAACPSIAINFRSFSTGCADPTTCGVEVADAGLQQGQGMHGSFSRAETRNIMGATGPSFRTAFEDAAPASNADLGKTIAQLLGLKIKDKGKLVGRVLSEAMPNGAMPKAQCTAVRSEPDALRPRTCVMMQSVGETRYFDAAGYPGRTLGLPADAGQ